MGAHRTPWSVPAGTGVGELAEPSSAVGQDATTLPGLLRIWRAAVPYPRLALWSAVGLAYAAIEMLAAYLGHIDRMSTVAAYLMVYMPANLVLTLPKPTGLWRISSLVVGIHVGPLLHARLEALTWQAYKDNWTAAYDANGMLLVMLTAIVTMPLLEAIGAWRRREALAAQAEVVRAKRERRLPTLRQRLRGF